jgi:putative exosortase-associated protein (TIGR04073 family)
LGVAAILVGMAAPAFANESSPSYMAGALRKLGRGVANVLTCPGELIRTPELVGRKDGYPAALTVGIFQGVWRTVLRGVVGVIEVGTFFVEIPKDFAPILQPEFVYAHGDWVE